VRKGGRERGKRKGGTGFQPVGATGILPVSVAKDIRHLGRSSTEPLAAQLTDSQVWRPVALTDRMSVPPFPICPLPGSAWASPA